MGTYTPIPYWLSLPVGALYAWSVTVQEIQAEDMRPTERG